MILVTGGAGYIGSHTCVELIDAGYSVVVLDNFSNSHPEAIRRIERITGKPVPMVQGDIRDQEALRTVFRKYPISATIHFAGLKAVGESVEKPLGYYDNNIIGTHRLLEAMHVAGVRTLVFSSSATVYGEPQQLPLSENHPLSATNPYGRTKLFIEEMLRDLYRAEPVWNIGILRYFNPVGAHKSGLIGENPRGTPNNLLPFVAQVAAGRKPHLQIFGNDYPTIDGTGVRDYIHVADLALGHLAALDYLERSGGLLTVNLGTGKGTSVIEIVEAFEQASGKKIPFQHAGRRIGDVAACWADPTLANRLLGWTASRSIEEMCEDAWRWQCSSSCEMLEASPLRPGGRFVSTR